MPIRRYDDAAHAYYDDFGRVASVTQVLSASGIGGYDIYRMMQATAPEKLRAAGIRGRMVHLASEHLDNGLLDWDDLDEALEPYLRAYQCWLDDIGFEPIAIERMVYHEHFRYAGRLDRIGMIGRHKWLVDLKSGILLPGHAYQTAAYLGTLPEPLTYERMLLQLCSDGTYHIATPDRAKYQTDFQTFLTALNQTRKQIEQENHDRDTAAA
jgi:hypothetical protein